MHKAMLYGLLPAGLVAALVSVSPARAAAANALDARQYYSNGTTVGKWHYYPQQKAYSIYYKYKPSPNYNGYQHHYAYYYPARPKYVYFYNPVKKQYWGRCPLNPTRQDPYQILDYADRHEDLSKIPEDKFKPLPQKLSPNPDGGNNEMEFAGPMPPIPGSDDSTQMDPPPPPPAVSE